MITVLSSPLNPAIGSFSGMLKSLDAQCRNCNPVSPLECIKRCRVYKLKNELRRLSGALDNPDYLKELFNVLKNETRLCILQAIVEDRCSLDKLQQQLKAMGFVYSQETIIAKYVRPLITVGLATETLSGYCPTEFGARIRKVLERFPELGQKLPAHSECHEETVLKALLTGPKTFEELGFFMPQKIATRVIKRLTSAGLVSAPDRRDYMFFFRTKRDPHLETTTDTEQKIYDAIPEDGISAGRLARKTRLCVRRTYKYLKRLKGKKLVFLRKTPKNYSLTIKGEKLALVLTEIEQIVEDIWNSSQQVMRQTSGSIKELAVS